MADLDGAVLVRRAAEAAAGLSISPPSKISRGPAGSFLGNESGTSTEFHDFRDYQPGDDLRRVDWGVYARSDNLVIRQFRIEVAPVVEVLLDTSASMGAYPGKRADATFAAELLCEASRQAEGRPVLVMGADRLTDGRIEFELSRMDFATPGDPEVASRWPRGQGRPMRILISDLLFAAPMAPYLAGLSRDAASLVVIQILSDTERDPSHTGGLRLVDVEDPSSHRDLHVNRAVVNRYKKRLSAHQASIEEACRKVGASLLRMDVPDAFRGAPAIRKRMIPLMLERGIVEVS